MGHVNEMYKIPSLTTEVRINILSIQHIPGSSYDPCCDLKYVIHIFKICILKNEKNLFLLYRSKIPDLVDTHLAILKPKPHLYTFFTHKSPASGQSFTAGIAKLGTTCYGHLAELYGNNIDSYYHKEYLRTSINMYASWSGDLDVAQVSLLFTMFN